MSRWLIAKTTIYKDDLSDMKSENPEDVLSGVHQVVPFTNIMEDSFDPNSSYTRTSLDTEDEQNEDPYMYDEVMNNLFKSDVGERTYEVPSDVEDSENDITFKISSSNLELFKDYMEDYLDYLIFEESPKATTIHFNTSLPITDDIKNEILLKAKNYIINNI